MTEGEAPRVASPTLATGAVGIIYDRAVLGGVMSDLQAKAYRVAAFDCRRWANPLAAGQALGTALGMPESLPRTLPVVGAYLQELARSDEPYGDTRLRMAVVLGVFDDFLSRNADALAPDEPRQASRMAHCSSTASSCSCSRTTRTGGRRRATMTIASRQVASLWTRAKPERALTAVLPREPPSATRARTTPDRP